MDNGNATYNTVYSESHLHELVYVALTILVTSLSALIASYSFLGLRGRRRAETV